LNRVSISQRENKLEAIFDTLRKLPGNCREQALDKALNPMGHSYYLSGNIINSFFLIFKPICRY